MSKCVEEDELGKIFSGMTIMVAFIPFATNPSKDQTSCLYGMLKVKISNYNFEIFFVNLRESFITKEECKQTFMIFDFFKKCFS